MTAIFERFVGIDYSGAQTAASALKGLQVYMAEPGKLPLAVSPPETLRHWSRRAVAEWLDAELSTGAPTFVGIDHGFSFPESYFRRYGLSTWPAFVDDFCRHWPTGSDDCSVDHVRSGAIWQMQKDPETRRVGTSDEFRLCERWTSSAKSVFQFDMQGSVAKSTHAGIPWLRWIRLNTRPSPWFWPFDGWLPAPGRSVIAEIYPSLVRNRFPREERSVDEQDAYAVARWLMECQVRGAFERYFNPPLTLAERRTAALEGWIFGVS